MINFKNAPLIMGVVNVTPDSFSDGGEFYDAEQAINHGLQLLEQGAHILDIGGESTKPNATLVTPEEEKARILPVIAGLKKKQPNAMITVDTRNASTMHDALEVGADIINDVSALSHDAGSVKIVATANCPIVLMHMQGTPDTMQNAPTYNDVVDDIIKYLQSRIDFCIAQGIKKENIIADPGIGFGKTLAHNLEILKDLDKFHALDVPLLLGASRKSFIEKIYPNAPADQRLAGSLAAALHGFEQNIQLFRVHDVAETAQAFAVWRVMK